MRVTPSSPPVLSRLENLLRSCIGFSLDAGQGQPAIESAEDFHDWSALLRISEAHGLQPLVAGCFDSIGIAMPADVRATLDDALYRNAKRVLIMSQELHAVLRRFEDASVPVLTVKGPVSAWTLYADPAFREFSDLDLLVPPAYIAEARRILSCCGYEPSGSHRIEVAREAALSTTTELPYENRRNGIHIDLHWEITPPNWFVSMPPNFWDRTRVVAVDGRAVRTLSEEDTFLHLCFHGAKHGWSNLNWLVDVCGLLVRSPGIGGRGLRLAEPNSRAAAMVQFALAASVALTPQLAREKAGVPERIDVLAQTMVRAVLRGETIGESALDRCRFQWKLGGSRPAMLRYIAQWIFTPDQTDWNTLPIQNRRLLFLLVPWRLLRLTRRMVSEAI